MTFAEYVIKHLTTPFVWGRHDCVTFTVGWLSHTAGFNFLAALPPWTTKREAHCAIKSVGGLHFAFDTALRAINPNCARDGDITLVGRTVYLFSGQYIVAPGERGLVFITRTKATCAWSL